MKDKEIKKVIFCGSPTGGHFFTNLNIFQVLEEICKKEGKEIEVLFFLGGKDFEINQLSKLNIKFEVIDSGKLRRYFSLKNFLDISKTIRSIIKTYFIVRKFKPDLIFGSGGYLTIPPVISGLFLRIPIFIHEQTAAIGLANRIILPFVSRFYYAFPEIKEQVKKYEQKSIFSGQTIRPIFKKENTSNIFDYFPELNRNYPILYIAGGSSGSHTINEALFLILEELLKEFNVIHQCGIATIHLNDSIHFDEFIEEISPDLKKRYLKFDFIPEDILNLIYRNCSLIIGRSGALTVSEAFYFSIPAIWIPYTFSSSYEQYKNAKIYEVLDGGIILEEKSLIPIKLKEVIYSLFQNRDIERMKENLSKQKKNDGSILIANDIFKKIFSI